jgi:hypothetical protein
LNGIEIPAARSQETGKRHGVGGLPSDFSGDETDKLTPLPVGPVRR